MKKTFYASVLAAGCSLLLAAGGIAAEKEKSQAEQQMKQEKQEYSQQQEKQGQQQQAMQQEQTQSQYARQLITPDKLNGMNIQNLQGEEIGSVDKVVLDSQNGQIAYVVVTSGGFWGIGGEKAVIPWNAVKLQQPQQQGQEGQAQRQGEAVLVVNVSKEQLKNAPQGEIQETLDRQQAEQIHQYYGVAPYWEGQQGQQQQQQMEQQQPQQMEQQQEQKEMKQEQQEEKKERMQ